MRPTRRILVAAALASMAVLASACASNFRTMRPPAPGATAPTTAPVATTSSAPAALNTLAPSLFVLTSSGFHPGGSIPATYTCDGAGTSPALSWADVPGHTVELVLAISDPQASSSIQWMVAGIHPSVTSVAAGATPAGGVVLANSAGQHAYAPLCPPKGQDHTFEFTLYALTSPSGLTANSTAAKALAKVSAQATGTQAVLTGDYQRP